MNRFVFILLALSWIHFKIKAQSDTSFIPSIVSYTNESHVYTKFKSTGSITIGDSLYLKVGSEYIPILLVQQKSSSSTVCVRLNKSGIQKGDSVYHLKIEFIKKTIPAEPLETVNPVIAIPEDSIAIAPEPIVKSKRVKQLVNGRFSISNNGDLNPGESNRFGRMRLSSHFNIQNISGSPLSIQSYITYRYRYGIEQRTGPLSNDLKVYTLSLSYHLGKNYLAWFGRRINPYLSNMGAADGFQLEYNHRSWTGGIIAGTRPDLSNYTFDIHLPQVGIFINHSRNGRNGVMQNSLAIAQQWYFDKTDRRFAYFQHSSNPLSSVDIFFSTEFDLFHRSLESTKTDFRLTGMYFSARYKFSKKLNVQGSYDNRRNIVFYESFPNRVDQLLSEATRQGIRLQANYSPIRKVNLSGSIFYRYQGASDHSTNYTFSLSLQRIPFIYSNFNASFNKLTTIYLNGNILSARMYRDFLKSKVNLELNYRFADYQYLTNELKLQQHIIGIQTQINISKTILLMLNLESGISKISPYHRYFVTLQKRIKSNTSKYKK
ncbi:MAG: hypothetical protein IPM48_01990 [Saprospiraceae bacterium]|nr:hypothetical protein [Saprospiraceae bacterium]